MHGTHVETFVERVNCFEVSSFADKFAEIKGLIEGCNWSVVVVEVPVCLVVEMIVNVVSELQYGSY